MVIPLPEPEPVCPIDVPPAHRWGAEPKRRLWRMKRGGSVVSKGACRAAARAGDYCEPDRAQRDHWFESSKHHQRKRSSARMAYSLVIPLPVSEPVCPIDVPPAHRWGAEPKRRLWRMKRGGSVVSKGDRHAAACRTTIANLTERSETTGSSPVSTTKEKTIRQ